MAATGENVSDDFPSELQDRLAMFDDALGQIEHVFKPLHGTPLNELHAKMSSLDKAKLDLVGAYAANSLFWMYLTVNGENPKEHGIKTELSRIQAYMGRVKELEDKKNAPRIDVPASKRFIRSALWQKAHKKPEDGEGKSSDAETSVKQEGPSPPKRPAPTEHNDSRKEGPAGKKKKGQNGGSDKKSRGWRYY